MPIDREQTVPVITEQDVVRVRHVVREWAGSLRFNLVDQTKLVTAASELARNMIVYGGGGTMKLLALSENGRTGLRLVFEDKGPGIEDINLAMQDGYTTGSGLGLGLGGAKRLSNEFDIQSKPGEGTRVSMARWRL